MHAHIYIYKKRAFCKTLVVLKKFDSFGNLNLPKVHNSSSLPWRYGILKSLGPIDIEIHANLQHVISLTFSVCLDNNKGIYCLKVGIKGYDLQLFIFQKKYDPR
jgi:hypothetical protein